MKKIQVKLNQEYRSFEAGFEFELEGDLVILSGINGGGKSQLINIINQQEGSDFNQLINSNVLLDGVSISSADIAYRSFKENITVPNFSQAGPHANLNTRNQIWNNYSSHNLNPNNSEVRGFKKSCEEARKNLIKEFGQEKFDKKQITQNEINKSKFLNSFHWKPDDIFSNIVSDLFFNYALKDLHVRAGTSSPHVNVAPWEQLNLLFVDLGFEYRFKNNYVMLSDSLILDEEPMLYQVRSDNSLDNMNPRSLSDLSEGEKAIISFAFSSLSGATSDIKTLLLLDEFDATLNPSLTESFFKLIQKYFILKGVMVIMVTHSPVTISLAPENANFYEIFNKRKSTKRIISVQRENYSELAIANIDFYSKTSNQDCRILELEKQNRDLEEILRNHQKPLIFVEGKTDKRIIEIAWSKCNSTVEQVFFIPEVQEGHNARQITHKLENAEVYNNSCVIGLFDFDKEGYEQWNSFKKICTQYFAGNAKKCLVIKHPSKNFFAVLLPLSTCSDLQSQLFTPDNEHFKEKSTFPIELLLYGFDSEFNQSHYRKVMVPGGGELIEFKGDKNNFSLNVVSSLDEKYFEHFKILFSKIESLIISV